MSFPQMTVTRIESVDSLPPEVRTLLEGFPGTKIELILGQLFYHIQVGRSHEGLSSTVEELLLYDLDNIVSNLQLDPQKILDSAKLHIQAHELLTLFNTVAVGHA